MVATIGPTNTDSPTSVAPGGGETAWVTPGNGKTVDATYAHVPVTPATDHFFGCEYLRCKWAGVFTAIPASTVILGLEIAFTGHSISGSVLGVRVYDSSDSSPDLGGASFVTPSIRWTLNATTDTTVTFGGSTTDPAGNTPTWTGADLTNLTVDLVGTKGVTDTLSVDNVSAKAYYSVDNMIAPAAASLTAAGTAAAIKNTNAPPVVALSTTLSTPGLKATLVTPAAALVASGSAPVLSSVSLPTSTALALSAATPLLGMAVAPAAGALVLTLAQASIRRGNADPGPSGSDGSAARTPQGTASPGTTGPSGRGTFSVGPGGTG